MPDAPSDRRKNFHKERFHCKERHILRSDTIFYQPGFSTLCAILLLILHPPLPDKDLLPPHKDNWHVLHVR